MEFGKQMEWIEPMVYIVLGIVGIFYAYGSYRWNFNPLKAFPGALRERKLAFGAGFLVMMAGFALSWVIGRHHELISLFGAWGMLLGASYWFNQRRFRREFAEKEWKIIRITLTSGVLVSLLSTGLFYYPKMFSPGTFLIGIALLFLSGRLWWNAVPE